MKEPYHRPFYFASHPVGTDYVTIFLKIRGRTPEFSGNKKHNHEMRIFDPVLIA
jgi:hypothetical protein